MRASFIKLLGLTAGVAVLLSSPHATAQTGFSDGPHYAYPRGGDIGTSKAGFGWQAGYAWNDYLSAEASVTRHTDSLQDTGAIAAPFRSDIDLEMFSFAFTGRISYPYERLLFHAGAGIGYYLMKADAQKINRSIDANRAALPRELSDLHYSADLDNAFGYHLALGVNLMLTPKWDLFVEYRWVSLDSTITYNRRETRTARNGPLALDRQMVQTSEDFPYDHELLRVGVNYRF